MPQRLAGTCYIKVDGEQLEVSGGLEAPISDTERESVMSTTGLVGYKETVIAPFVKVRAVFVPEFPLAKLQNGTTMTVTAEFSNKKVYTLSDAFLVGESSVGADDGTVELTFNGKSGIWQ